MDHQTPALFTRGENSHSHLVGRVGEYKERAAGMTGRSPRRELLALLRFQLREPLEDERVRLIGQLGDQRKVITTEAVGIVIVISLVHVGPGERDAVEFLLAFVLPHGGFNAAKAEGLYRWVRGGSGVLVLPRRLSVFVWHI